MDEPHSGITGENQGQILNLTDSSACKTRSSILTLSNEEPQKIIKEISDIARLGNPLEQKKSGQLELFDLESTLDGEICFDNGDRNIVLPDHHEVRAEDVDLKRLGGVLATAYENQPKDFETLLLTPGLGPRTLQSLTLVSEVIHGTPCRFRDPARFSFAHGGKDGHPFPVPTKIYDESIRILGDCIEKSKMGYNDKSECLRRLHQTALEIEKSCSPEADFDATLAYEKSMSKEWGGRTVETNI